MVDRLALLIDPYNQTILEHESNRHALFFALVDLKRSTLTNNHTKPVMGLNDGELFHKFYAFIIRHVFAEP